VAASWSASWRHSRWAADAHLLFGIVQPFDAATFVTGGVVLLGAAFTASMLPALSAARTPPATVLNTE
jgi:hypothetical protein